MCNTSTITRLTVFHKSSTHTVYSDEAISWIYHLFCCLHSWKIHTYKDTHELRQQSFVSTHTQVSYLFTEVRPFEGDHADVDGVGDKGLVVHELVGGEGGYCVEEELSSLFEVPDGHAVQALVHLQTIPPVPVSPLLDEAVETEMHRQMSTENITETVGWMLQSKDIRAFTSLLSLSCVWWGHYPCRRGQSSAGRRRYLVCDPEPLSCHRSSWRLLGRPPVDTQDNVNESAAIVWPVYVTISIMQTTIVTNIIDLTPTVFQKETINHFAVISDHFRRDVQQLKKLAIIVYLSSRIVRRWRYV